MSHDATSCPCCAATAEIVARLSAVEAALKHLSGRMVSIAAAEVRTRCAECEGSGVLSGTACAYCKGTGRTQ